MDTRLGSLQINHYIPIYLVSICARGEAFTRTKRLFESGFSDLFGYK